MQSTVLNPEQLAVLERCRFKQQMFVPYPSLKSIRPMDEEGTWYQEMPYRGQRFDPSQYQLIEGGWDHEHCWVCSAKIIEGDNYWPNTDLEEGGEVDLCDACYRRYQAQVQAG